MPARRGRADGSGGADRLDEGLHGVLVLVVMVSQAAMRTVRAKVVKGKVVTRAKSLSPR